MKTPDWITQLKTGWGWIAGTIAAILAVIAFVRALSENWALGFVISGGVVTGIMIYFLVFISLAKKPRQILVTGATSSPLPRYEQHWRILSAGGLVIILGFLIYLVIFPVPRAFILSAVTGTPASTSSPTLSDMVMIPEGKFIMGSNSSVAEPNAGPERKVFLDRYWIDKYEVSNEDYQAFVLSGYPSPSGWKGSNFPAGKGDLPVINVSWHDAMGYCSFVEKRLPTEAEWEKAARGTDGRPWPWGDERNATYANTGEPGGLGHLASVTSFDDPKRYANGLANMAGNVWEWVNDWYEEDYYQVGLATNPPGPPFGDTKVVRGGAWTDALDLTYTFYRLGVFSPDYFSEVIGFRCACTACRE